MTVAAPERCYTVMRLARQRWGCRPSKVRALIKAGALAAFTLGNRVLIPPESVAAFEQGRQVKPVVKRSRAKRDPDFVEYY